MGKIVDNPRKYVVSCRVDDDEMRILQRRARNAGVSITKLLRNCLDLMEAEARRQAPDQRNHAC